MFFERNTVFTQKRINFFGAHQIKIGQFVYFEVGKFPLCVGAIKSVYAVVNIFHRVTHIAEIFFFGFVR